MGVKFSQLPNATAVASEDYIAMLDTSAELLTKIPVGHASSNTVFGAGSTSEYGHNKVIDDLTKTSYAAGESLSAHQGNMLANDIGAFESSNTATVAHAAGEFFMWRSQFVKVTAAIAVGNTIATGVNVAATSISAVLGQLGQTVGFIGTTAEINAAIQSGAITEGMLVYNTDDEATQSITASQISFSNTGTGMSATDVQSAITELNSDLNTKVSITTVEGDTYATALGKLKTAVNWNKITEKSTLHTYGVRTPLAGDVYRCNDRRGIFSNAHSSAPSFNCYTINILSNNTSVNRWSVDTNGATYTSLDNTTIEANVVFEIWY